MGVLNQQVRQSQPTNSQSADAHELASRKRTGTASVLHRRQPSVSELFGGAEYFREVRGGTDMLAAFPLKFKRKHEEFRFLR